MYLFIMLNELNMLYIPLIFYIILCLLFVIILSFGLTKDQSDGKKNKYALSSIICNGIFTVICLFYLNGMAFQTEDEYPNQIFKYAYYIIGAFSVFYYLILTIIFWTNSQYKNNKKYESSKITSLVFTCLFSINLIFVKTFN